MNIAQALLTRQLSGASAARAQMSSASEALLPVVLGAKDLRILGEGMALAGGILLLSLLAQVSLVLPWTPVPITGQTLAVTLVALSWGRKRALAVFTGYCLLGFAGLPILALGKAGFLMGPTMGYPAGMLLSSYAVGWLADRGFTKTFTRSLLAAYLGSAITLGCGIWGLSFYLPHSQLLVAGLLPFLPGDLVKNLFAATLSWKIRERV